MQGGTAQHGSAYGVKYQARCIAPYVADPQRTRFLVGTQCLREENEVHVITLPDNSNDIVCEGLYTHQNEIWDLAICPFEPQIISTVYASVGEYGAALWRIPDRSRGGHMNVQPLQNVASLDGHTHTIKCTLWWPSGKYNQVLSIDAENLFIWDVNTAQRLAKVQAQLSAGELHHMAGGAWDPHDVTNVATAIESSVQMWDLRSMKQSSRIEQAHAIQVRDIDFNPKNEHILVLSSTLQPPQVFVMESTYVGGWDNPCSSFCDGKHPLMVGEGILVTDREITAGDDSKIRVWDLKMPGMPLRELPGHSHWTWRVRYNPTYGELVLTWTLPQNSTSKFGMYKGSRCTEAFSLRAYGVKTTVDLGRLQEIVHSAGTDSVVNLWQVTPVSSSGSKLKSPYGSPRGPLESLMRAYTEHEDSVYGIAWSARDPWVFASLSYDGRVMVDSVPQHIRKQIAGRAKH